MSGMDIVAFLTARLREEKAAAERARKAGARRWWARNVPRFDHGYPRWQVDLVLPPRESPRGAADCFDEATAAYIARHDPARTLREVAAKRAILMDYQVIAANAAIEKATQPDEVRDAAHELVIKTLRMVLQRMATAYADHPDYQEGWKP